MSKGFLYTVWVQHHWSTHHWVHHWPSGWLEESLCIQETWTQSSGWLLDQDVTHAGTGLSKVEPDVVWRDPRGSGCDRNRVLQHPGVTYHSLSNSDLPFKAVNNHTRNRKLFFLLYRVGTQTIAQEKVSWRSFNWEHFRGKKSRWKHLNKASLTLPKTCSGSSNQTFDIFTGRTNLMWAFYPGKMYFYFKMKWWRSRGWIFNWQGAWQLIGTETVSKCYVSIWFGITFEPLN